MAIMLSAIKQIYVRHKTGTILFSCLLLGRSVGRSVVSFSLVIHIFWLFSKIEATNNEPTYVMLDKSTHTNTLTYHNHRVQKRVGKQNKSDLMVKSNFNGYDIIWYNLQCRMYSIQLNPSIADVVVAVNIAIAPDVVVVVTFYRPYKRTN